MLNKRHLEYLFQLRVSHTTVLDGLDELQISLCKDLISQGWAVGSFDNSGTDGTTGKLQLTDEGDTLTAFLKDQANIFIAFHKELEILEKS